MDSVLYREIINKVMFPYVSKAFNDEINLHQTMIQSTTAQFAMRL
jgi:hypothetical protein